MDILSLANTEFLVASAIGILTAAGMYLVMRMRTFPVIMGVSLLTYAVNVFLFASGRLVIWRTANPNGRRNLHRSPAPSACSDRHRHLVRHDGGCCDDCTGCVPGIG